MRLLVFAHRAEAATFLKQGNFSAKESATNSLYFNGSDYLLICSEGLLASLETVSTALAEIQNIREVLNYGIAGSLSRKVNIDQIYKVRTFYAKISEEVEFKSYTSKTEEIFDCISSSKRVLNKDYAQFLSAFAQIVDREAWSIARACSNSNIEFTSYKYISDMALDNEEDAKICEVIKERAEIYSDKMWKHFLSLNKEDKKELSTLKIESIKEFYLTVSQFRTYNALLSSLLLNFKSEEEVLKICHIDQIKELKLTEKQRSTKLLEAMKELLTPFNSKLTKEVDKVLAPLKKAQINVKLSKDYESDAFNISAKIHNEVELQLISNALKRFDYNSYKDLLRGNLDV